MATPLLQTKLYTPPPRPELVPRPRLIERLNAGIHRKFTLISAPAGFGKTTLVSEWVASLRCGGPQSCTVGAHGGAPAGDEVAGQTSGPPRVAWLSLDEADNDLTRFLTYLIEALRAALQEVESSIGESVLGVLQSPQPPLAQVILTTLLNELIILPIRVILVLDDYHLIDAPAGQASPVHDALAFFLRHLPPATGSLGGLHLVIATREDPPLPLARLRARGQLTELRAADLRFTPSEAAEFFRQTMGLELSAEDTSALETRTEGWIAGLQLAALALQGTGQGQRDVTRFVRSFSGSHHFVVDYLLEEVLRQQPESVQRFLLQTAVLDRLTGSLCDAVRFGEAKSPTDQENGQAILEMLERANLFIVPLDNERRWYRYHHLFADLLRQRLHQNPPPLASRSPPIEGKESEIVAEYHRRASIWYEDHDLEMEAFHHAAAANDVVRAECLIEGKGMPLHFRGAVLPVLNWLQTVPPTVLDTRPSLWVTYASTTLASGQRTGVEQKLQAAEAALQGAEPDDKTQDLVGRIAAIRATLAVDQHQVETIIAQSRRALEYLHPDNLAFRTSTAFKLGLAYQLQGDRAAASRAYQKVISIGQASGNTMFTTTATIGLGDLQRAENQLHLAAQTYRRSLQLLGDQILPIASGAYLGLACVLYEWNDLDAAHKHGQKGIQLARQRENTDRFITYEVFLARLKLALGDVVGAAAMLAKASESARQHNFMYQMPKVAAAQVLTLLRQGDLETAAHLAQTHELPISQARVLLAQGDTGAALVMLESLRRQAEVKGWQDDVLKTTILQAVALRAQGETDKAIQLLGDALVLAEPGGFIRTFVDEGPSMARLLYEALSRGTAPDYVQRLLAAFPTPEPKQLKSSKPRVPDYGLVEPLSERELQVLQLIAEGLTNTEIASRLYLSVNTVKGHARNIYGKLGVHSRTQAVAQAQRLGLIQPR